MTVEVRSDGSVRLSDSVICDGFSTSCPIRIQTHVHFDHMAKFESSKKQQARIVLSEPTFDLLGLEHADMAYRSTQFLRLSMDGSRHDVMGPSIELYPSGHTVGSCMPVVEEKGHRTMYTSDFSWPLALLPTNIDVLVVDATYGDPSLQCSYTSQDAIAGLLEAFDRVWKEGPVVIIGHRGRLQYAYQLLSSRAPGPFVFSRHIASSIAVFGKWQGFHLEPIAMNTLAGGNVVRSGERFVAFVEERDREEVVGLDFRHRIWLSRFTMPREAAVVEYPNGLIRVALTDHADFPGTIALIRAINPRQVITDSSRGGSADELAHFVRQELKIPASSAVTRLGPRWGD